MDVNYIYHLWITDQTGNKTCCDQIVSSATSVCVCPELIEAIKGVVWLAHHPQEEEEEPEEEYQPDEDSDLWDYG